MVVRNKRINCTLIQTLYLLKYKYVVKYKQMYDKPIFKVGTLKIVDSHPLIFIGS